ncbi:hypothetical protein Vau01_030500 [Virgisporangium aurantiacum]|uniref:Uncharacterized protein n=2 Tax=Virgisporangium aurantiacum TaxID=175570 RepID=A0A8J3Z0R6_9ACTN|nr:hypothetical protein Vau01_030500 [Virgisporangium aurantiacum]
MPASAVVDRPVNAAPPPANAPPGITPPGITPPANAPPATAPADPLVAIMPPDMAEWVVRRHGGTAPTRLDRAVVYQLYRAWDETTASDLPPFSTVVGALHAAAYDLDAAYPDAAGRPGLRERAGHARAWLYRYAPDRCWILGPPRDPADPGPVRDALAAIRAGAEPTADTARAARRALFGVDGGPGLRGLRQVFGDETIAAALDEYLRSGARPLRDRAEASP